MIAHVFIGLVLLTLPPATTGHADPTDPKGFVARGDEWKQAGEYDKAIKDYTEAIRLDPKFVPAFIGRGWATLSKGEIDRAMKDFDEAVRLDPKNPEAFYARAGGLIAKKEFDGAIADLTEAIKLNPKFAEAYTQRSMSRQNKGDWAEALKDAEEGVRLAPKNPVALHVRGMAHQGQGEWATALADYEKSIELEPRYTPVYANKAAILAACPDQKVRDGKKALLAATVACDQSKWRAPFDLEVYAMAAAESGDFAEAVKWQKKVMENAAYVKVSGDGPRVRLELYQSKKPFRLPIPSRTGNE